MHRTSSSPDRARFYPRRTLPLTLSPDAATPPSREARIELLKEHLPGFSAHTIEFLECARTFVNGDSMSQEDCRHLSELMAGKDALPDVPLLVTMQQLNPGFVPVVALKSDAAQESIRFLLEANGRLMIAVCFDDKLPVGLAIGMHTVMSSPQSTITGFCYHSAQLGQPDSLEFAASQKILEQCITDATALQFISGPGLVLQWIKRSVPELRLSEIYVSIVDELALERVLGMGGVNKLVLSGDSSNKTFDLVADAVLKANASVPPGKCVHELEVMGGVERFDSRLLEKLVRTLFSIKHLTKLTLTSPGWLTAVPLAELKELVAGGSLQHLDFSSWKCRFPQEKNHLKELGSTIEQNRKRAQEWALGPARAVTLTLTNGSEVIERLAQYIAEDRKDHLSLSSNELITINHDTEKFFQKLKK